MHHTLKLGLKLFVALFMASCFASTAVTLAVLYSQKIVPSSGKIVGINVNVYSDASCTLNLTSISWGSVYPSDTTQKTFYVKNNGNAPLTLSMTANAWTPTTASNYLSLAWNRENTVLNADQSTAATVTLTVSANAQALTFGVNIIIVGSG